MFAARNFSRMRFLLPIYFIFPIFLFSQEKSFTLKEAVKYALANNVNCLNAEIDASIAKAKKNEVIGAGLPQISGSFDTKDFVQLPTSLLPARVLQMLLYKNQN